MCKSFHADRLGAGLKTLALGGNPEEILNSALALLPPGATGRLRVQVWRKGEGAYLPVNEGVQWTYGFAPLDLPEPYPVTDPVACCLYPDIRTCFSPLSPLKTGSALAYVMAALFAREQGADDALLLTPEGFLAEASSSNLFWIREQELFTPPLTAGCVAGVMRRAVMQAWLEETGHPVREARILPEEAPQQQCLLLTNAIRGVRAVGSIGGTPLPQAPLSVASLQRWLRNRMDGSVT